jgi:subtilisin family serine protease
MVLFCAISMHALSAEVDSEAIRLSAVFTPADSDRILLVGFSDSHIDRIQNAAASTSYRRRGPYKSSTWSRRITSRIEEQYGLLMLSEWPMTEIGLHCAVYQVPVDLSVEKAIESLSQDGQVDVVQRMHQFSTEGHRYNDPYYRLQSNMHQMDIEQAHSRATGKNVTIAVIDTGVDMGHPDLAGQFEFTKNFVSAISSGFTNDIHGTAVTGIIAARKDNQTGIIGVAPDVKIIALKACWPNQPGAFEAICNSFTLALAVNTAIRLDVDVLNMSLAGPEDPLLEKLLKKAKQNRIIVVAADPGQKDRKDRFPASMEEVIPVQPMLDWPDDRSFSEDAINAPGEHILTTFPYGTYDFVSGSSMAAAQVSGLIALMLELNPELNADQVKAILQKSHGKSKPSNIDHLVSSLNAGRAIQSICEEIRCPVK